MTVSSFPAARFRKAEEGNDRRTLSDRKGVAEFIKIFSTADETKLGSDLLSPGADLPKIFECPRVRHDANWNGGGGLPYASLHLGFLYRRLSSRNRHLKSSDYVIPRKR